jgi:hypothetical protein
MNADIKPDVLGSDVGRGKFQGVPVTIPWGGKHLVTGGRGMKRRVDSSFGGMGRTSNQNPPFHRSHHLFYFSFDFDQHVITAD